MPTPANPTLEPIGLTGEEARARLAHDGPNEVPEKRPQAWRVLASKFWAPVPWMLELTLVLEWALGKRDEALVILLLLVVNAVLSFHQEQQAQGALELLQRKLAVQARALRDGRWQLLPARELVAGDVIHVRMGDLLPADLRLDDGELSLDRSALTGESLPVGVAAGDAAPAGAIAVRGEATGTVTATGTRTTFGRTIALVGSAHAGGHAERVIFKIVRALIAYDVALVLLVLLAAFHTGAQAGEILPYALILLLSSVPVALPATFTLATALGAIELSQRGVLVTRLAAIEEAASMTVLCCDKTGTLTENRLVLAETRPLGAATAAEVLHAAAAASDAATQDPLDLAILAACAGLPAAGLAPRARFVPFDPATKRSEAVLADGTRVLKGAPRTLAALCGAAADALASAVTTLADKGYRVLAVAAGEADAPRLIGLLGFYDPPREEAPRFVAELRALGVRVVMVTGDAAATAATIAERIGLGRQVCRREELQAEPLAAARRCDVFAGVLPEEKLRLVEAFQRDGQIVGMTGDGVNDAPALKQAEVGLAVANATDVAKSSASLVLTDPGPSGLLAVVQSSRRIFGRLTTYTLNKIIKTFEVATFLSLGFVVTGRFVTSPLLVLLLMFTNDVVTMAIATDNVPTPATPQRWRVGQLVRNAAILAALMLVLSFGVFLGALDGLKLPLAQVQTLVFVMLVAGSQGMLYSVRERGHFWASRPSGFLLGSTAFDLLLVGAMAWRGVLMAPLAPALIAGVFVLVAAYLVGVDFLKVALLRASEAGDRP